MVAIELKYDGKPIENHPYLRLDELSSTMYDALSLLQRKADVATADNMTPVNNAIAGLNFIWELEGAALDVNHWSIDII